ncbi:hypothetical protein [Holospora obtusa]|nr:hypothetical protein [Holospora obtusa]
MKDSFFVPIIEKIRSDNVDPVLANFVLSFFNLEQRFTKVTSRQFQGMLFDILYSNEHHLDEVLLTSMNLKEHLDTNNLNQYNCFYFVDLFDTILASYRKLPLIIEITLRSLNFKQMCAQLPLSAFEEYRNRRNLKINKGKF